MSKLRNDQTGFSAVEAVLVVVIVAAVGFVGWYVWHSKQASDKVLSSGNSSQATTTSGSTKASNAPGSKDNQALQTDLSSVTSSSAQSGQDLNNANKSLNDKSTFTSVPQ